VLEHSQPAVVLQMLVEAHAVAALTQDAGQRRLANFDWLAAHVDAVQLQQVERIQERLRLVLPAAQNVEPDQAARHWPFWSALRAAGVPLSASWLDADFNHTGGEPTPDQWRRHWQRCVDEAAAADVTLMFAQNGERQMGALLEAGAALGAGRQVYCVSPHSWSFRHHERVRNFDTLEQAVAAIVRRHDGECAREKSCSTKSELAK
jgi:hypothetical protein